MSEEYRGSELQAARTRIAELEAAMLRAHGILGSLSMGTEGALRQRICTVYNIIGEPIGKPRSSHGEEQSVLATQFATPKLE